MHGLFWTSRRHWWERVNNTVIEFHLSVTSGSSRARTRIAHLVDRDANDCAISPSPSSAGCILLLYYQFGIGVFLASCKSWWERVWDAKRLVVTPMYIYVCSYPRGLYQWPLSIVHLLPNLTHANIAPYVLHLLYTNLDFTRRITCHP